MYLEFARRFERNVIVEKTNVITAFKFQKIAGRNLFLFDRNIIEIDCSDL